MSDRLQEIRARLDAATPGPWEVLRSMAEVYADDGALEPTIAESIRRDDDADLIAHAPADIAWLLAEIDAMRERVAVLRAEIADLEGLRA